MFFLPEISKLALTTAAPVPGGHRTFFVGTRRLVYWTKLVNSSICTEIITLTNLDMRA